MITDEQLPDGWEAESARDEYDEMMEREYQSRRYEHESGEARVSINDVQEPKEFEGWGYQVVAEHEFDGGGREELGLFEDLDAAREAAIDYMETNRGG